MIGGCGYMIKIKKLANAINDYCKDFDYFWAYGMVKETATLWESANNRELLCDVAKIMYEQEGR